MSRQSKKLLGFGPMTILAVVAFVIAAAAAFYLTDAFQRRGAEGKVTVTTPPTVTLTEQRQVTIYLPKKNNDGVYLAPEAKMVEAKGSALDVAMSSLIAVGQGKGEAAGLIPEGTKLLSPVKVTGEVAAVNLSKQFADNFSGGTMQEALTLNSIIHTLVNASEGKVKKALILVEGKPADTLGGAFDLSEPVAADSTLLKPESKN